MYANPFLLEQYRTGRINFIMIAIISIGITNTIIAILDSTRSINLFIKYLYIILSPCFQWFCTMIFQCCLHIKYCPCSKLNCIAVHVTVTNLYFLQRKFMEVFFNLSAASGSLSEAQHFTITKSLYPPAAG